MNRQRFVSHLLLALAAALFTGLATCSAAERLLPEYLRCEYQVDPLGIDETAPRLSWRVSSTVRDERQTAWRILVSSSKERLEINTGDLVGQRDRRGFRHHGRGLSRGGRLRRARSATGKFRFGTGTISSRCGANPQRGRWDCFTRRTGADNGLALTKCDRESPFPAQFDEAKWIWYCWRHISNHSQAEPLFMSNLELPAKAEIEQGGIARCRAMTGSRSTSTAAKCRRPQSSDNDCARIWWMSPTRSSRGTNMVRVEVDVAADRACGIDRETGCCEDGTIHKHSLSRTASGVPPMTRATIGTLGPLARRLAGGANHRPRWLPALGRIEIFAAGAYILRLICARPSGEKAGVARDSLCHRARSGRSAS